MLFNEEHVARFLGWRDFIWKFTAMLTVKKLPISHNGFPQYFSKNFVPHNILMTSQQTRKLVELDNVMIAEQSTSTPAGKSAGWWLSELSGTESSITGSPQCFDWGLHLLYLPLPDSIHVMVCNHCNCLLVKLTSVTLMLLCFYMI